MNRRTRRNTIAAIIIGLLIGTLASIGSCVGDERNCDQNEISC